MSKSRFRLIIIEMVLLTHVKQLDTPNNKLRYYFSLQLNRDNTGELCYSCCL